jgi:chitinase
MSYDLVHGYSTSSGHHTPLFSTVQQTESTEHAVKSLIRKGVPRDKLIIGAAFYGRYFAIQEGAPVGLYQPGRFDHSFSYRHAKDSIGVQQGFIQYWDATAQAPYAIHLKRRLLATYDNEESVLRKTDYALHEQLGGMMFWQLMDDQCREGLLAVIERRVKQHQKKRLR